MTAYYNEIDPYTAEWLRILIKEGHIANGDVDERSIVGVRADDLRGYTQCHFFAGIGGWSYALRLAGWPDNRPVWTGSCPCQPFSQAGKRKGFSDDRHLWPQLRRLIAECKPPIIFGEQVAGKSGREWLTGVRLDLEALGYACGASDLCAASVGAPHIRQRLYWMADANQERWRNPVESTSRSERNRSRAAGMDWRTGDWIGDGKQVRFEDGSDRRTKPGVGIMVDGFPGRVATVGGFGNAIVPQVAAAFVAAASEAIAEIEP